MELPISRRENLMMALNHEKPMWMPSLYADAQIVTCKTSRDMAPTKEAAGFDWFGTRYDYSAVLNCNMPNGGVMDDITQWREKVKWPDMDALDWTHDADGFVRDENLACYARLSNGIFERIHAFMGFEQALQDMLVEPDECREFFLRLAQYKIDLFNKYADCFPLDFVVCADDYGTARAPFFSCEMYEDLLYEPTRRYVEAVYARGVKFFAHCCGCVTPFVPYFVKMGVDGIEIQQDLNDLSAIMKEYGDKLLIEVRPSVQGSSDEDMIASARAFVDTYGAHTNPGSGGTCMGRAATPEQTKLLNDEIVRYSMEKYAAVR
ncbi:MAG: hypothetical protein MJ074_05450 [Oscillospiraceae bacterium]|nr:hypothetical protein [Oscillospiraceae bacterium]